ncbi:hypothetical protein BDW22DRAFT_755168 [Trametopsis cervina]|nr:hypothetical protein BDW22DRAFT_755168 [Trametopsis cervina]
MTSSPSTYYLLSSSQITLSGGRTRALVKCLLRYIHNDAPRAVASVIPTNNGFSFLGTIVIAFMRPGGRHDDSINDDPPLKRAP